MGSPNNPSEKDPLKWTFDDKLDQRDVAPQVADRTKELSAIYARRIKANVKTTALIEIMLYIDYYDEFWHGHPYFWMIRRGGWRYDTMRGVLSYMEMVGWIINDETDTRFRRILILPAFRDAVKQLKRNLETIESDEDARVGR